MDDKQNILLDTNQEVPKFFKILLEKCIEENCEFIIASIPITFIIYFIIPKNNIIFVKLKDIQIENRYYIIILFFMILCIFISIKNIITFLKNTINKKSNKKYEKEIEELWSDVDKMLAKDYELLLDFIASENKPYYITNKEIKTPLLSSDWVYEKELSFRDPSDRAYTINVEYEYDGDFKIYKYILKDDKYNLLKYSFNKYNRISHFKR